MSVKYFFLIFILATSSVLTTNAVKKKLESEITNKTNTNPNTIDEIKKIILTQGKAEKQETIDKLEQINAILRADLLANNENNNEAIKDSVSRRVQENSLNASALNLTQYTQNINNKIFYFNKSSSQRSKNYNKKYKNGLTEDREGLNSPADAENPSTYKVIETVNKGLNKLRNSNPKSNVASQKTYNGVSKNLTSKQLDISVTKQLTDLIFSNSSSKLPENIFIQQPKVFANVTENIVIAKEKPENSISKISYVSNNTKTLKSSKNSSELIDVLNGKQNFSANVFRNPSTENPKINKGVKKQKEDEAKDFHEQPFNIKLSNTNNTIHKNLSSGKYGKSKYSNRQDKNHKKDVNSSIIRHEGTDNKKAEDFNFLKIIIDDFITSYTEKPIQPKYETSKSDKNDLSPSKISSNNSENLKSAYFSGRNNSSNKKPETLKRMTSWNSAVERRKNTEDNSGTISSIDDLDSRFANTELIGDLISKGYQSFNLQDNNKEPENSTEQSNLFSGVHKIGQKLSDQVFNLFKSKDPQNDDHIEEKSPKNILEFLLSAFDVVSAVVKFASFFKRD